MGVSLGSDISGLSPLGATTFAAKGLLSASTGQDCGCKGAEGTDGIKRGRGTKTAGVYAAH